MLLGWNCVNWMSKDSLFDYCFFFAFCIFFFFSVQLVMKMWLVYFLVCGSCGLMLGILHVVQQGLITKRQISMYSMSSLLLNLILACVSLCLSRPVCVEILEPSTWSLCFKKLQRLTPPPKKTLNNRTFDDGYSTR